MRPGKAKGPFVGRPDYGPHKEFFVNDKGAPSVHGTVVRPSANVDFGVSVAETNSYEAIGVVNESGVPVGEYVRVVVGGVVDVLVVDGTAAIRRAWTKVGATPGRIIATLTQPEGSGFNNAEDHFRECGHCLEAASAGSTSGSR